MYPVIGGTSPTRSTYSLMRVSPQYGQSLNSGSVALPQTGHLLPMGTAGILRGCFALNRVTLALMFELYVAFTTVPPPSTSVNSK